MWLQNSMNKWTVKLPTKTLDKIDRSIYGYCVGRSIRSQQVAKQITQETLELAWSILSAEGRPIGNRYHIDRMPDGVLRALNAVLRFVYLHHAGQQECLEQFKAAIKERLKMSPLECLAECAE